MKILLDTNIVIHREASHVKNQAIGALFYWLDKLHYTKCIHPITLEEIKQHKDTKTVATMTIKLDSYTILKTEAPLLSPVEDIINSTDKNQNDKNDSKLLNELLSRRVDALITEDKTIHEKATLLNTSESVFTITSFLEKIIAENPSLIDYKVLSIRKEYFGNINLKDPFFDNFKEDYIEFTDWFNEKAEDIAYISTEGNKILGFIYLKIEYGSENYSNINPNFTTKKRLKIGSFKVLINGYRLSERFLKIVFDNAIAQKVDEIYVTLFNRRLEQQMLVDFLREWGFVYHGKKTTKNGEEEVYIRDFRPQFNVLQPKQTFPYLNANTGIYLNPIYPKYHTELFPDSILRTESPHSFIENQPHRNSLSKVYISRSIERSLKTGDIIIFYRTGGYYQGCLTTLGIVESLTDNISNIAQFIKLCRKRSVFSNEELVEFWDFNKTHRPFIVNFLYSYSFTKKPNLKRLIELGIVKDYQSAPRGFTHITGDQFKLIINEAGIDESLIVN